VIVESGQESMQWQMDAGVAIRSSDLILTAVSTDISHWNAKRTHSTAAYKRGIK